MQFPNLRFPEFEGEWTRTFLSKESIINPKTPALKNEFVYIDLESVVKGELINANQISKLEAPSRAQRVLSDNDILFQCVRPYQLNNYVYHSQDNRQWVASTGYAQIRTKHNINFLYQLLNSPRFNQEVILRCTGTSYPAIASTDLGNIPISICSETEQAKIGKFLHLLDQRITTQSQIIEELKKLRSMLSKNIFLNMKFGSTAKLKDLCSITTGKLDANEMVENGVYPFFTCAEEVYRINKYAFDTEALLISGNGANVGYIHYYNGKFNAYQRTYVLSDFKCNIQYIKNFLQLLLPKRIDQEKNTGNTPYIVLGTLADMKIELPENDIQNQIIQILSALDKKITIEKDLLKNHIKQKQYLLQNLFI